METPPLKVVCGVICFGGRILVTRRDPVRHFPLLWEFPGGKVEPQESPEQALHRELDEELGLKVEIIQPLPTVEYRSPDVRLNLYPFLCKPTQREAPVPVDHPEIRWIEPQHAETLAWAPPDEPLLSRLAEWLGSIPD